VILADTSVWVDHLRVGDQTLAELLDSGLVLAHPFVIGELALGRLRQRETILEALSRLPRTVVATDAEVLTFIDGYALFGRHQLCRCSSARRGVTAAAKNTKKRHDARPKSLGAVLVPLLTLDEEFPPIE
jgi:predicted nucleic acid-binding protein